MYDTYGFPMEITQEILEKKGFVIDMEADAKARAYIVTVNNRIVGRSR